MFQHLLSLLGRYACCSYVDVCLAAVASLWLKAVSFMKCIGSMVFMVCVDCVPICTISRFAVMAVRFDGVTSKHDQPQSKGGRCLPVCPSYSVT